MNNTTQTYPRQSGTHKPEQVSIFGPYTPQKKYSGQIEFWISMIGAFLVGYWVRSFWS